MKPHELKFNYLIENDMIWLACEFESGSKNQNTLTSVSMEGFKLDTMEMTTDHPELYDNIIAQMKKESAEYWDELKGDQDSFFKKLPNLHPLNFFLSIFLIVFIISFTSCSASKPKYGCPATWHLLKP